MFFTVKSERTTLITTENLEYAKWSEKLDQLESVSCSNDRDELIAKIKIENDLNEEQLETVTKSLTENSTARYFRIFGTNSATFRIEPVYLNLNRFDGKLIYWKDWDYIFYDNNDNFYLWVYLGGMSDMWTKIILSKSQIEKYKTNGFSEIDYLVRDLRNWKNSTEYEKAKKENRIIQ